jgi:membrane-bound lytic murein transglycosylase F
MRSAERTRGRIPLAWLAACACLAAAGPPQSGSEDRRNTLERAAAARAAARASARFDDTFQKYSKRYFGPAFDWRYFKAQAMAESGLDPEATSAVGARGLMQLMPSTYQMIQSKRPELGSIDDPEWNIAAGIHHDRYLWRLWSKDVTESQRMYFTLGSYNAGEGTITRATGVARAQNLDHAHWPNIETVAPEVPRWRYRETLGYVRRIEIFYEALRTAR